MAGRNKCLLRFKSDNDSFDGTFDYASYRLRVLEASIKSSYYKTGKWHNYTITEVGYVKRIPIYRVMCCGKVYYEGTLDEVAEYTHYSVTSITNGIELGMYRFIRIDTIEEKVYYEN